MITAEKISFKILQKVILDNVDIEVCPNSIVGLAGMNGAGKSTLLKILSGQHKKFDGRISYNNQKISEFDLQKLATIRSVLPQSITTAFSVKGKEIVMLGRMFFNESESIKEQVYREVIDLVKCEHLMEQYYETMSGGEKQRVQLARVLAQIWLGKSPRYLFLDEPISSLDIAIQHEVMTLLTEIKARNIGVLVILHDINLMLQYCDNIYFLKQGKLVAQGNNLDLINPSLLAKIFNIPFNIVESDQFKWIVPKPKNKIKNLVIENN